MKTVMRAWSVVRQQPGGRLVKEMSLGKLLKPLKLLLKLPKPSVKPPKLLLKPLKLPKLLLKPLKLKIR